MSLVEDFYNQKIYKIRHIHSEKEDDYDTYIFIGGFYDDNFYKILHKLEKEDYIGLTDNENKIIGTIVPNFRAKIGKIVLGRTHFIHDLIFDDDSINIIRMKISKYISSFNKEYIPIHQQHLWIETYNVLYKDMINFINYMLGKNSDITVETLIVNLQKILDVESQEEIEKIVKKSFNEKYKNKKNNTIELFNKDIYTTEELVNHEEFILLLTNRKIIIGRKYIKQLRLSTNYYIDYPQYVVANPFSSIISQSDSIIMNQDSIKYSTILNDYGLIKNNIIYLVTHTEFVNSYKGNNLNDMVNLYWDNQATDYTESKLTNEKKSIEDLINNMNTITNKINILSLNRKNNIKKYEANIHFNKEYLINDLVIGINEIDYPSSFDIEQLFNIFETNIEVPFVKMVINETTQNFKIYKPFLKKNVVKLKVIASWKNIQNINDIEYPSQNKKYLVFKLLLKNDDKLSIDNYITVNIYENGYTLVHFNINDNISLKYAKEKLEDVSNFIIKLKKLGNLSILNPPETSLVFKGKFHQGILRTQILNLNLKNHVEIVDDSLTLSELNNRIDKMMPFFYGHLKNNTIKMIYKKVSEFDSEIGIQNFIYKLFEKNKKILDGQKNKYLDLLENIFIIDRVHSKQILDGINPSNIPENIKYHFLYGVDISISKEKNKFIIHIDNLHQITQLKFIHELLLVLFDSQFDDILSNKELGQKNISKMEKDIVIDIEDKESITEIVDQMNLGFEFGELGFEDLQVDIDIEEEYKKKQEEKKAEEEKKTDEKIEIDYDLKKKGSHVDKIKFTNYMIQMRVKADPGLYKVEDVNTGQGEEQGWKYSTSCDATQMRQPYVIPKENLEKIKDKKAITGYVKYRDQYYICPRIWDYKAEMPISTDEFIKNGLKSPYTNGEAIPADKRNKEYLGDKYTVIVRKPTSSTYWTKDKAEKGWPEMLKNTGSEAYPGFMKPKNHPKNLCVPCCFLKEPDDFDPNATEIQRFKKPVGHDVCEIDSDSELPNQSNETREFDDGLICKNENYIKADIAILDNCRYGQLPENLNTLLRNNQEILISASTNSLHKYTNCFLRRGVFSDKNSFLRSIASIKESITTGQVSFKTLIKLITDNLTPDIFITLNQGTLINIFKFNYSLPRNNTQIYYFSEFVKKYPKFVGWLGLPDYNIEKVNDLILLQKDKLKLRKVRKLFVVFSAFHNFIKYCQDDKIIKRHDFFIDLISRPLDWLFPQGVNIIMFSKETNNIYCNPYITTIDKPVIMLLYDKNGKFEPIFHIQSKGSLVPNGVIKLDNTINMSTTDLISLKNNLKNQPINVNLLKETQKRLPILKEIVKIHITNCGELSNSEYGNYKLLPPANIMYEKLKELSETYPEFEPYQQITSALHNTEFIITVKKLIFPVRPSAIILDLSVHDGMEYFHLIETKDASKILESLHLFNSKTNNKYYYNPAAFLVTDQNKDLVIGILLENNGLIPIYPSQLTELSEKEKKLNLKMEVIVKNIYYEADYKISEKQINDDDRIGYLKEYQQFEYLYQHFKYEITMALKENKSSFYLNEINAILGMPLPDFNLMTNKLIDILTNLSNKVLKSVAIDTSKSFDNKMKKNMNQKSRLGTHKKKYNLGTCQKISQKKCNLHPYCILTAKSGCNINLETTFWSTLFIKRLAEGILRNQNERKHILEGTYIPAFYYEDSLQLSKDEIFLTNENFYLIRQIYKSSKYHQEIDVFEPIETDSSGEKIIKATYEQIVNKSEEVGSATGTTNTNTATGIEVSDLSGIKKKLKTVYATVFDKDGKYRSQYNAGPCIFPYVYGNTKQLYFDCNKDKDEGQRCPVEVDKFRRALKWGFCPADPRETRRKNNVQEINAKATNNKGKIDKGFKSGKCIFPFRYHPSYDLSWECVTTKHGKGQKWCATNIKTGKNIASELPIAADRNERIYQKKWDYSLMNDEKGEFNDDFLRYSTRCYCPTDKTKELKEVKPDKNIINKNDDKYEEINLADQDNLTIDNFVMNKCIQTDSKGGYSKKVLKKFAIEELNFTEQQVEGIKKEELCHLIGEKLTNLKSRTDLKGKTLLDIYKKDPKMCEKGESGGGWYLSALRKMASRYFGMDPEIAIDASKKDLCNFIVPVLDKEMENIKSSNKDIHPPLSSIYTKNPLQCEEGPSKGGYTLKELKEMGVKYFGIPDTINNKEQICEIIRDKLNNEKETLEEEDRFGNSFSSFDDSGSFSFLDELGSLGFFSKSEKTNKSSKKKQLTRKSNKLSLKHLKK